MTNGNQSAGSNLGGGRIDRAARDDAAKANIKEFLNQWQNPELREKINALRSMQPLELIKDTAAHIQGMRAHYNRMNTAKNQTIESSQWFATVGDILDLKKFDAAISEARFTRTIGNILYAANPPQNPRNDITKSALIKTNTEGLFYHMVTTPAVADAALVVAEDVGKFTAGQVNLAKLTPTTKRAHENALKDALVQDHVTPAVADSMVRILTGIYQQRGGPE